MKIFLQPWSVNGERIGTYIVFTAKDAFPGTDHALRYMKRVEMQ